MPKNALMVCVLGKLQYDFTTVEREDSAGNTKDWVNMKAWIDEILNDIVPGWYVDVTFLKGTV